MPLHEQPRAHSHLYTATFQTLASVVTAPTDSDRLLAKASLQPLRALLPAGIDVEAGEDVLYFAAPGALIGVANKNDDLVGPETAIAIHRSAIHKYVNVEHQRDTMVGCIVSAGLSHADTNQPLSDTEAAALGEPFNMSVAGVIWKTAIPQLSRYLVKVGDTQDNTALSLSWELAFSAFAVAYGSRDLRKATIVMPGDPQFDILSKALRAKGGTGRGPAGQDLYRVILGDAIVLGYGIVEAPAGNVKGILPITESALPEPARPAVVDTLASLVETPAATLAPAAIEEPAPPAAEASAAPDQPASISPQVEESFITLPETRVTTNNAISMKIESLAHLKTVWPDLQKQDAAVALASVEAFVDAFQKANDKFVSELTAQKDISTNLESTKAAAETRAKELEASLAQVQKQLDEVKSAQAAAAANASFQDRMKALDEAFDLDNEDRELLAAEVRLLADDAAFAAFKKKQEKLMCGKKKGAKAAVVAAPAVTTEVVVAAVASITPVAGQTTIPAGQPSVDTNLADEMDAAFGSSLKVGGKTVAERKAIKAAATKE